MRRTGRNEYITGFLERNSKRKPVSFHMPGHKYGRFPFKMPDFGKHDITEIPGADNIRQPEGVIKASAESIAKKYGSDECVFLTNGSTQGVHAIMAYAAATGKRMILARNCHMSAVSGAALFNTDTAFAQCDFMGDIALPPTPGSILECIEKNEDATGILITSPNYYGMCADIGAISVMAAEKGLFLAVDEAHGAHFAFSGNAEKSALANGADMVCHSLHKTMPAYNQGALLHLNGNRVDFDRMRGFVAMLGTSSPSYPILESMEKAVVDHYENGERYYSLLDRRLARFKKKISANPGLKMMDVDDPARIVIDVSGRTSGYMCAKILSEKYSIDMEAADGRHIVGIATPSNTDSDFTRLAQALLKIETPGRIPEETAFSHIPEKAMEIHEAVKRKTVAVKPDDAAGRICGTMVVPYPPGIPLVCPGEKIGTDTVRHLRRIADSGCGVIGLRDDRILVLEQK